jgi:hypothetical protein
MSTVEMKLQPNELSGTMAEMRIWLDRHRFEPAVFSSRGNGADVLVRVGFKASEEAEAFADRFAGRIGARAAL